MPKCFLLHNKKFRVGEALDRNNMCLLHQLEGRDDSSIFTIQIDRFLPETDVAVL